MLGALPAAMALMALMTRQALLGLLLPGAGRARMSA
jgi:hypothetical protein